MLAPANGFNHAHAHDAVSDTEAVIYLCRMIKDRCPDLWDRFLRFSSKARTVDFLQREDAFVVLEVGGNRAAPFVVTAIGDPANSSPAYCYDLNVDPTDLRGLSDADLANRLGKRPNPLRKVKFNQAPTLIPLSEAPLGIHGRNTTEEYVRRGRLIRSDTELTNRLLAVANATATAYEPSPHVERQIYDGFYSRADERLLYDFHSGSWEERVAIADKFHDSRATWLARRLIFAERPHLLAQHHRAAMASEKAARMTAEDDECGGWMTLAKVVSREVV
jgi:exodeoxyribonuclease-1